MLELFDEEEVEQRIENAKWNIAIYKLICKEELRLLDEQHAIFKEEEQQYFLNLRTHELWQRSQIRRTRTMQVGGDMCSECEIVSRMHNNGWRVKLYTCAVCGEKACSRCLGNTRMSMIQQGQVLICTTCNISIMYRREEEERNN